MTFTKMNLQSSQDICMSLHCSADRHTSVKTHTGSPSGACLVQGGHSVLHLMQDILYCGVVDACTHALTVIVCQACVGVCCGSAHPAPRR